VCVCRSPYTRLAFPSLQALHSTPIALRGPDKASRSGDTFEYSSGARKLRFRPFYALRDETYNTYFTMQMSGSAF
jgi:hypothetical protein